MLSIVSIFIYLCIIVPYSFESASSDNPSFLLSPSDGANLYHLTFEYS